MSLLNTVYVSKRGGSQSPCIKTTKLFSVRLVKREGMGYIRGDEFYDI